MRSGRYAGQSPTAAACEALNCVLFESRDYDMIDYIIYVNCINSHGILSCDCDLLANSSYDSAVAICVR